MNKKQNYVAIIKDKRGRVLSVGKNSYTKTHPLMFSYSRKIEGQYTYKVFLHAEIDAIIRCTNLEKAFKIEVYRINKRNEYSFSRPCKICLSAIQDTNIQVIGYINEYGNYEEKSTDELMRCHN